MHLIGIECASSARADEFAALVAACLGGEHVLREERDLFSNHNSQKFALKQWGRNRVRVGMVVQSPGVARSMLPPGSEQRQLFEVQVASSPRLPPCDGHVYLRCPGEKEHRTLEQWYRNMHDQGHAAGHILVLDPTPHTESEWAHAAETFRAWVEQFILDQRHPTALPRSSAEPCAREPPPPPTQTYTRTQ